MVTLYITHDKGILGKNGGALSFREVRGGKEELIPPHLVDDVVLMGRGSISTSAIHLLMEQNIPVHFIDGSGHYKGSLTSGRGRGYAIKRLQFDAAQDEEKSLIIARKVVSGKLLNQRATLLRVLYRHRPGDPPLTRVCHKLVALAGVALQSWDMEELRGIEGYGAAEYFSVFGRALLPPWEFSQRNRRPPKDPVNALLSFGYTLLLGRVTSAVTIAGLDPCVGFLHPEYRGRPSLALDLMEEFRSPVVDRMIISLLNQQLLSPENFSSQENGGVMLDKKGRLKIVRSFSERIRQEVVNRATGQRSSFWNHCDSQARFFIRSLQEEGSRYTPFSV
nr:CRISPR-associated endonuclease Cas1 [uncultured Dethiosulfovibrio sp.]